MQMGMKMQLQMKMKMATKMKTTMTTTMTMKMQMTMEMKIKMTMQMRMKTRKAVSPVFGAHFINRHAELGGAPLVRQNKGFLACAKTPLFYRASGESVNEGCCFLECAPDPRETHFVL